MDLTKITAWIKANLLITVLIGVAAIALIFPKVLKGLFGSARRRVHHRGTSTRPAYRTYVRKRKPLPRSVGMSRIRTIGRLRRPKTGRYRKGTKKPWQIKGSLAARRHMALIRKRR
jgi:hypothetical protein